MKTTSKQLLEGLRSGRWLTLSRLRGYSLLFCTAYVVALVAWVALSDGFRDRVGNPLGTDFINVYAAGRMVQEGRPDQVYNWTVHHEEELKIAQSDIPYYGWHYPPMFLGVASLLALAPYFVALCVYLIFGFLAYLSTLKGLWPGSNLVVGVAAAFPGVFINIGNGQNGFLTTSLLGVGLLFLEQQPLLAGFFLGLLAYKPQFFILIPIVLLVGGYGRALVMTGVTSILTALLSYQFYGLKTWQAFVMSTHLTQNKVLEQGAIGWHRVQSIFAVVRMWGGDTETAYIVQASFGLCAVIVALILWRSKVSLAIKAASLVAATALVTPYILDYDLVVLAIPIVFLARQGMATQFEPFEKSFLAGLWLLPFIARLAAGQGLPLTSLMMIMLSAGCFLKFWRYQQKPQAKMPTF